MGLKMISPLLDHMVAEKEVADLSGRSCYILRDGISGERFLLKQLSIPESDGGIRALILSGAYANEQAVHEYYGRLVRDIRSELEIGKKLAASGNYLAALSYQVEEKASGVGYDVYILYPLCLSLTEYIAANAVSSLRAINLAIDLCDALAACREGGYLHLNLCPENVYLTPTGRFLLGGLGLTDLDYLQYAGVPEEYLGDYSAPELSDITASPNTTVDLYALGMILYRIYNGNHGPFEDESTNAAMADKLRTTGKPLPSPLYADYELAGIILKACAFAKEERYQSPDALKQALTLYMQRNAVSDTLIVPPIVAEVEPVPLLDEEAEAEPMRMTDVDALDDNFKQSFAPDLSGAGGETIEPTAEEEPAAQSESEPAAEEAESAQESPEESPEEAEAAPEDAETEETAEANDPDQLDLDGLLASINDIVRSPEEEPQQEQEAGADADTEPSHDYVDAQESEEELEEEEPPQKKRRGLLRAALAALLLCLAVGAFFLLRWYFVDVSEMTVVSTSPTQIVVELTTKDDPSHFSVSCADAYGNVYAPTRDGKQYTFSGLREKTSYTISVTAAKHHKFSAATPVLTETTDEYTVLSYLAVERLSGEGDALFSFEFKGPAPTAWTLTYEKEDGTSSKTFPVDGGSCQISGLELYTTYRFTLEAEGDAFLSGENTLTYEALPLITASDLAITDVVDQTVTLSWVPGETLPQQWVVTCEAEGMQTLSVTTDETTAQFTLPDLTQTYTFRVDAVGMDKPAQFVLDTAPILVSDLAVSFDDDGRAVVTWDAPIGEPQGDWCISYRLLTASDEVTPTIIRCPAGEARRVTLDYLPANADFEVTVFALDTENNTYPTIFGVTACEFTTPEATPFSGYSLSPSAPVGDGTSAPGYVGLWLLPEKENWTYDDLRTGLRTTFSSDERIAFCVEAQSHAASSDLTHVIYALRNADGQIVRFDSTELPWNDLWYSKRHVGEVLLPTQTDADGNVTVLTGDFTFEVYFNGKLLAVKNFTVQ